MKIFLLFILFSSSFSANATSFNNKLLRQAENFAIREEKKVFLADDVQVIDSYFENRVAYVTIGPEWQGRPARVYHCWKTIYNKNLQVIARSRMEARVCREL
ncbi:MAG: hypothetical protein M9962_14350 [Oligoflexia bacterium]|nr:hypothetical protein [Oligoflexia bacterium]